METKNIYILEKYRGRNSRFTCPSCGKSHEFTRYINQSTGERLPEHVGICNRRDNCGYKYTAWEYFNDNPDEKKRVKPVKLEPEPPKPTSFIDSVYMYRTMQKFEQNNFFLFLRNLFGEDMARNKMIEYNIGTSTYWYGSSIFWQEDHNHNIRTGKVMLFNPETGKRIHGKQNWVHAILKEKDFNLSQCLFGEHLFFERWKENLVGLVESEKTAVIASCFLGDLVWLATGGKSLFNPNSSPERFNILKDKTVIIYPDLALEKKGIETPYEEWSRKAEILRNLGVKCIVSDFLEKKANHESRQKGEDIADYLIREQEEKGKNKVRDEPIL